MASKIKLTKKLIDSLAPRDQDYRLYDSECRGLEVRVRATGGKGFYFVFRSPRTGQKRNMKLSVWTVEQARELADGYRGQIARGVDPYLAKITDNHKAQIEGEAAGLTVRQLLSRYAEEKLRPGAVSRCLHQGKDIEFDYTYRIAKQRNERRLGEIADVDVGLLSPAQLQNHHKFLTENNGETEADRVIEYVRSGWTWGSKATRNLSPLVNPAVHCELNKPTPEAATPLDVDLLRKLWAGLLEYRKIGKTQKRIGTAVMVLTFGQACRMTEILCLRISDVDMAEGTIRLRFDKKGKARNLPITSLIRPFLAEAIMEARNMGDQNAQQWLFPSRKSDAGRLMHVRDCVDWLRENVKGLEKFKAHSLRDTSATLALESGMTEEEVMEVLDHNDVATTRIYLGKLNMQKKRFAKRKEAAEMQARLIAS